MQSSPVHKIYVFIALGGTEFVPCGLLTAEEIGRAAFTTFQYGLRYLERPNAVALDPEALPLPPPGTVRTYTSEAGTGLPGAIRDVAPDQWGRFLMHKAAGKELNDLECLLALSDLRIGDLAFGLTPAKPKRNIPWSHSDPLLDGQLNLAEMQEAVDSIERNEHAIRFLERFVDRGSSLGGSRPKASIIWKNEPWIAKFTTKRDTFNAARVEFATMTLAKSCGLSVPELDLTSIPGGPDVFLIKRFDRKVHKQRLSRQGFLSGLTATGLVNLSDSVFGGVGYRDLVSWLRKHGAAHEQDIREIFMRMVFNILCNNTDDHLKNHGFLRENSEWRLSPLYDVVPSHETSTEGRRLLLAVGARGREASLENALSEARLFGLHSAEAEQIISRMKNTAKNWRGVFKKCGVSKKDIEYLASSFIIAE